MSLKDWLGWAKPPAPGLYTYRLDLSGGKRRLHLRVETNGAGALFVDVNEVIHLNATATEIAKWALDGVAPEQAQRTLWRRYGNTTREQRLAAVGKIYLLIARLKNPTTECPTCAIADWVEFKPVFSTPVNAPFKADLALTYACNNACAHCYNEAARFEMASLSLAEWQQVLDKLAALGVPHIILTGGEPTLHPDLLPIIQYAEGLGLMVGMNSNGRRLAHRLFVEALAEAGLDHVQITLESSRGEVHNTMVGFAEARAEAFEQTVAGIRNAVASGLHTITNTTLTAANRDHAVEIVDFVHGLGLHTFAMNGMIYAGGGALAPDALPSEDMAALLVAVRDRAAALDMRFLWYTVTDYCRFSPLELGLDPKRCNAAEYSICIEPNGDVLPCQSYYVSAGNILNDPWDTIWNSALFRSFRDRETDPLAAGLPEACWDCPDLPICGGGCRLEHEHQGAPLAPERGCGRGSGNRK
ncbi:MAG: radical SAM protein [Anaerolineae bacterium]|nr:radical SAM protein [Anaerolineae bacterium]